MKNYFQTAFLFIVITSLFGCASTHIPLEKKNSTAIKTVYINPEIKKPDGIYTFASGSQIGMAFGVIGGLAAGSANNNLAVATQDLMNKNHISINNIVYNEWKNQLNSQSKFKLASKSSDAVLTTDVIVYGISIPHGFSSDYVPVLTMNAKLTRNNQVIWQDKESVSLLESNMPRYKIDQIKQDPSKLQAMWQKASERIINKMIRDMNA